MSHPSVTPHAQTTLQPGLELELFLFPHDSGPARRVLDRTADRLHAPVRLEPIGQLCPPAELPRQSSINPWSWVFPIPDSTGMEHLAEWLTRLQQMSPEPPPVLLLIHERDEPLLYDWPCPLPFEYVLFETPGRLYFWMRHKLCSPLSVRPNNGQGPTEQAEGPAGSFSATAWRQLLGDARASASLQGAEAANGQSPPPNSEASAQTVLEGEALEILTTQTYDFILIQDDTGQVMGIHDPRGKLPCDPEILREHAIRALPVERHQLSMIQGLGYQVLQTGTTQVYTCRMLTPAGTGYYEGRIVRVGTRTLLHAFRNRTEEHLREQARSQGLEMFRALVQRSSDVLLILTSEGFYRYISPSVQRVAGYQESELMGQNVLNLVHPEDQEQAQQALVACLQNPGQPIALEARFRHAEGHYIHVETLGTSYIGHPNIQGVVVNVRDITQRRIAEERLELALRGGGLAAWEYDPATDELRFRFDGADSLRHLAPDGTLTLNDYISMIHPRDRPVFDEAWEQHLAGQRSHFEAEYRIRGAESNWLIVLDRGRIVESFPEGQPRCISGTLLDVTQARALEAQHRNRQTEILEAVIRGQDQERKRIGSELHDGVLQLLGAGLMHLGAIEDRLEAYNSHETGELRLARDILQETLGEIRDISHNLVPQQLNTFGLPHALESLCHKLAQSRQLDIRWQTTGTLPPIDRAAETSIYRLTQEALQNAVKHAEATTLHVGFMVSEQRLTLTVADDGKGFDLGQARRSGGLGLMNFEARIRLLGGQLEIDSAPGAGTRIEVVIPLPIQSPEEDCGLRRSPFS